MGMGKRGELKLFPAEVQRHGEKMETKKRKYLIPFPISASLRLCASNLFSLT
jgi:hypothetical protein